MVLSRDQRVANLAAAAAARTAATTARAERVLNELRADGRRVTFPAVAAAAQVSLPFLYNHPTLRARISQQRDADRQRAGADPAPAASDSVVEALRLLVATLKADLQAEQTARRSDAATAHRELAAAHGEILRLQRLLPPPAST